MNLHEFAFESEEPTWICSGHVSYEELERRVCAYLGQPVAEVRRQNDIPDDLEGFAVQHRYGIPEDRDGELWVEYADVDKQGAVPITTLDW